jgi:hypothetical protein
MRDFLKKVENGVGKGWDTDTRLWSPHSSVEGGTDTLAFGHKLTKDEINSGLIHGIPYKKGITTEQANQILDIDIDAHKVRAAALITKQHPNVNWEGLSTKQQDMLTLYEFNGVLDKFKNYRTAVLSSDWDTVAAEYKVYSGGKPLGRNKEFYQENISPELNKASGLGLLSLFNSASIRLKQFQESRPTYYKTYFKDLEGY